MVTIPSILSSASDCSRHPPQTCSFHCQAWRGVCSGPFGLCSGFFEGEAALQIRPCHRVTGGLERMYPKMMFFSCFASCFFYFLVYYYRSYNVWWRCFLLLQVPPPPTPWLALNATDVACHGLLGPFELHWIPLPKRHWRCQYSDGPEPSTRRRSLISFQLVTTLPSLISSSVFLKHTINLSSTELTLKVPNANDAMVENYFFQLDLENYVPRETISILQAYLKNFISLWHSSLVCQRSYRNSCFTFHLTQIDTIGVSCWWARSKRGQRTRENTWGVERPFRVFSPWLFF